MAVSAAMAIEFSDPVSIQVSETKGSPGALLILKSDGGAISLLITGSAAVPRLRGMAKQILHDVERVEFESTVPAEAATGE